MNTFKLALSLVILSGIVGGTWWATQSILGPKDSGSTRQEILWIPRGKTPPQIAHELKQLGIIDHPRILIRIGNFLKRWEKVKAGEYRVSPSQTPLEILTLITSGQTIQYPFTVREGANIYEISANLDTKGIIKGADFLQAVRDPALIASLKRDFPFLPDVDSLPSLEGYLFPETYQLNRSLTAADLVRRMVAQFAVHWKAIQATYPKSPEAQSLSDADIVTLASIIEKETGAPQERPLISSVFHNRLKKRMRLQSDPTIIYGLGESYKGNLRKKDITTPSPYNTYTIARLPIGPIANPGREALIAALRPASSDYLYFVSQNDGTHQFSATLNDHNSAVRKFQLDRSAREGKSWRQLSEKLKAEGASKTP